jgi:hypothetical protein
MRSGSSAIGITYVTRVSAYAWRRADAQRELASWDALDLNEKMKRGPLESTGPEAESYTRYSSLSAAIGETAASVRLHQLQ